MKKLLYFFIIVYLIFFNTLLFSQDVKPKIAVMDLDAKGEISKADAEAVSDFLRTDLVNTKKFTVVERSRINDLLKEQELSLTGLTEVEKATKIGKFLNCKYILVGSLSKLGNKYFLNVRIVDVETSEIKLAKRESTTSIEAMSDISKSIAYQLAGLKYVKKEKNKNQPEIKNKALLKPGIGVDLQLGFSKLYKYRKTITTNDYVCKINSDSSILDLRGGIYFNFLYFGIISKNSVVKKGSKIIINETFSSLFQNTNIITTYTNSEKMSIKSMDFILGVRGWHRGKLDSKVAYISYKKLKTESDPENINNYSGWGFGIISRSTYNLTNTPVDILINFGIGAGWLSNNNLAEKINIFAFNGELGVGFILKRIGIYSFFNYNLDGFYLVNSKKSRNVLYLPSGFEFRIGYNFDLQALNN